MNLVRLFNPEKMERLEAMMRLGAGLLLVVFCTVEVLRCIAGYNIVGVIAFAAILLIGTYFTKSGLQDIKNRED